MLENNNELEFRKPTSESRSPVLQTVRQNVTLPGTPDPPYNGGAIRIPRSVEGYSRTRHVQHKACKGLRLMEGVEISCTIPATRL